MTLASISTLSKDLAAKVENIKGVEAAKQVGLALAKICKEKYYAGYLRSQRVSLHGRVKAIADGAREGGLKF